MVHKLLCYYHLFSAAVSSQPHGKRAFSAALAVCTMSLLLCVVSIRTHWTTPVPREQILLNTLLHLWTTFTKKIRTCSAQVHFLRSSSEISAPIMAIWSYFTGEGSVSKASLCSSWNHHTLTALSLLLSEGRQYLLPGLALQQPNKWVKSIQLFPGQTKCSQAVPVIVQNLVGISRELEICWNKKSLILSCLFCHTMLHCSAAK